MSEKYATAPHHLKAESDGSPGDGGIDAHCRSLVFHNDWHTDLIVLRELDVEKDMEFDPECILLSFLSMPVVTKAGKKCEPVIKDKEVKREVLNRQTTAFVELYSGMNGGTWKETKVLRELYRKQDAEMIVQAEHKLDYDLFKAQCEAAAKSTAGAPPLFLEEDCASSHRGTKRGRPEGFDQGGSDISGELGDNSPNKKVKSDAAQGGQRSQSTPPGERRQPLDASNPYEVRSRTMRDLLHGLSTLAFAQVAVLLRTDAGIWANHREGDHESLDREFLEYEALLKATEGNPPPEKLLCFHKLTQPVHDKVAELIKRKKKVLGSGQEKSSKGNDDRGDSAGDDGGATPPTKQGGQKLSQQPSKAAGKRSTNRKGGQGGLSQKSRTSKSVSKAKPSKQSQQGYDLQSKGPGTVKIKPFQAQTPADRKKAEKLKEQRAALAKIKEAHVQSESTQNSMAAAVKKAKQEDPVQAIIDEAMKAIEKK